MKSKFFIFLTLGIFYFSLNVYAQKTYTIQGSVYDSYSNQPVKNAQVWLHGIQAGGITDSLGNYKFEAYKTYSETRMYLRICGDEISTSKLIRFGADTLIQTEFYINGVQSDCTPLPNIPWKVSASEAVTFEGYVFLDLHGDFFKTCNGDSYSPIWPEDLKSSDVWPINSQFGDSLFIQIKGRIDPYSEGLIPSQKLYVGEILVKKEPTGNDCVTK